MRRERAGGLAMIVGALMGIVTMALHPTSGGSVLRTPVHALAMVSLPIAFYGAWVLTQSLAEDENVETMAHLALAFWAMSAICSLLAATFSGLLLPQISAQMPALTGEPKAILNDIMWYNVRMNEAFARVLIVASSVAIALWSVAFWRTARFARWISVYGIAIALASITAIFMGVPVESVHAFGALVLVQVVWLIAVGLELRSASTSG